MGKKNDDPKRPWLTPEWECILDTFSGADGGAAYLHAQTLYAEMLKRAAKGDQAAAELVAIVHRFAKFLDTAERLGRGI